MIRKTDIPKSRTEVYYFSSIGVSWFPEVRLDEIDPQIIADTIRFLKERRMSVRLFNALTTPVRLNQGVPQGSTLGPVRYLSSKNTL